MPRRAPHQPEPCQWQGLWEGRGAPREPQVLGALIGLQGPAGGVTKAGRWALAQG